MDRLTWQDYEADLDRKIEDLHARVHSGKRGELDSDLKCGAIGLELRVADLVAEAVERREDPHQRPQRLIGLVGHARRQYAQREVRIVPEERRDDGRAQRRAQLLVEIVFQCERAVQRGGSG